MSTKRAISSPANNQAKKATTSTWLRCAFVSALSATGGGVDREAGDSIGKSGFFIRESLDPPEPLLLVIP